MPVEASALCLDLNWPDVTHDLCQWLNIHSVHVHHAVTAAGGNDNGT